MLQKKTVTPSTLEVLKELMNDPILTHFVLVGGTALALQIGHHKSVDLDLFSETIFDSTVVSNYLKDRYAFSLRSASQNTLFGFIKETKIDMIQYPYPIVKPLLIEEGIRMASLEDIAAMKLNAIMQSGDRYKDYIDIAFLGAHFPLENMLAFYEKKYKQNPAMIIVKALRFYDDLNSDDIKAFERQGYAFKKIEQTINLMVSSPDRLIKNDILRSGIKW